MTTRRAAFVALLAAALAAGPAAVPAAAGEYPVFACDPAVGDVNHSWFPESNNPKMAAYANCPVPWNESRAWNQGLVTRPSATASGTDHVGYLSFAALRLRAPPGATLSRITYRHTFCGGGEYQAGVLNDAFQWLHSAGPEMCGTLVPSPWTLNLNGTRSVVLGTFCVKASCELTHTLHAWGSMRSATVWVRDSTAPSVAITGGSLVSPGWRRGTQSLSIGARDNVGIKHADVYLDNKPAVRRDGSCNWTYTVPCGISLSSVLVDSRIVADGTHMLIARVQDSAGNWGSLSRRVLIDNTAPSAPLDLHTEPGPTWTARNSFDAAWTNPPQRGQAPIAAAGYAICPASNRIDDYRGCASHSKSAAGISSLTGLRVPGPGAWSARIWLADAAYNADVRTADSTPLLYDPEPPSVAILAPNLSDPERIDVRAGDRLSGVARVDVEIQRAGASTWTALPVTRSGSSFVARIDDAALPSGRYRVRARAIDAAGNERSTLARSNGIPALMDLPVRVPTALRMGGVRHVRRHGRTRTVLRRRPTASFGEPVLVRGRLTLPGHNPLAGANLDVFEHTDLPGRPWRRIGMVRTGRRGYFSYRALPGPSRYLRVAYGGTSLLQPKAGTVHLKVRASTSFRVNRHRVVNGDEILFRGRVRGMVPRAGKLVQLQAYSRGTWRTFATPRARASSHRWRYRYRFSATRGLVRYRFRASLPPESGFPYVRGSSRRLRVTVRGL